MTGTGDASTTPNGVASISGTGDEGDAAVDSELQDPTSSLLTEDVYEIYGDSTPALADNAMYQYSNEVIAARDSLGIPWYVIDLTDVQVEAIEDTIAASAAPVETATLPAAGTAADGFGTAVLTANVALNIASGSCLSTCPAAGGWNEFGRLNDQEKKVCARQPYDCRRAAPAKEDAERWTAEYYVFRDAHNTEADAFRHCMWSGMMTKRANSSFAKSFGDAHEYGDDGQPIRERDMDLHNNSWGRQGGRDLEGRSQRDMADRCSAYARWPTLTWFKAG